jgi:hypothetical protein
VSLSFADTPLTDLSVEAKSQAVGGTKQLAEPERRVCHGVGNLQGGDRSLN